MYLDDTGNITQANGDAGDCAARSGFCGAVLKFRERLQIDNTKFLAGTSWRFEKQWPTLFTLDHRPIRNPRSGDSKPAWSDPSDTSRDQCTPLIIAFGMHKMTEIVEWCAPKAKFLGLKFYPNGDFASPSDMNTVRRALRKVPTDFGDFWLAQSVSVRIRQASKDPDDVGDDLNTFISLVFSYLNFPSLLSTSALKRYLRERPFSLGSWSEVKQTGEKDNVLAALAWYCRKESGGNPELAELCRDLIVALRAKLDIN